MDKYSFAPGGDRPLRIGGVELPDSYIDSQGVYRLPTRIFEPEESLVGDDDRLLHKRPPGEYETLFARLRAEMGLTNAILGLRLMYESLPFSHHRSPTLACDTIEDLCALACTIATLRKHPPECKCYTGVWFRRFVSERIAKNSRTYNPEGVSVDKTRLYSQHLCQPDQRYEDYFLTVPVPRPHLDIYPLTIDKCDIRPYK